MKSNGIGLKNQLITKTNRNTFSLQGRLVQMSNCDSYKRKTKTQDQPMNNFKTTTASYNNNNHDPMEFNYYSEDDGALCFEQGTGITPKRHILPLDLNFWPRYGCSGDRISIYGHYERSGKNIITYTKCCRIAKPFQNLEHRHKSNISVDHGNTFAFFDLLPFEIIEMITVYLSWCPTVEKHDSSSSIYRSKRTNINHNRAVDKNIGYLSSNTQHFPCPLDTLGDKYCYYCRQSTRGDLISSKHYVTDYAENKKSVRSHTWEESCRRCTIHSMVSFFAAGILNRNIHQAVAKIEYFAPLFYLISNLPKFNTFPGKIQETKNIYIEMHNWLRDVTLKSNGQINVYHSPFTCFLPKELRTAMGIIVYTFLQSHMYCMYGCIDRLCTDGSQEACTPFHFIGHSLPKCNNCCHKEGINTIFIADMLQIGWTMAMCQRFLYYIPVMTTGRNGFISSNISYWYINAEHLANVYLDMIAQGYDSLFLPTNDNYPSDNMNLKEICQQIPMNDEYCIIKDNNDKVISENIPPHFEPCSFNSHSFSLFQKFQRHIIDHPNPIYLQEIYPFYISSLPSFPKRTLLYIQDKIDFKKEKSTFKKD